MPYGEKKNIGHFFSHCHGNAKKPLEIYLFVDPLCPECWALEPIIKKLLMRYGRFFTLKHIISGNLASLNAIKMKRPENMAASWDSTACRTGMSCDGSIWFDNPISSAYAPSVAIKAAELQGRKSGIRFLRKLQEVLFTEKQDVSDEKVLIEIAGITGLDKDEFIKDLHSESAVKALQCDMKITAEMEVSEMPTIAFFNERVEEEGLKIAGYYPYEMYEEVLFEMLGETPPPSEPPPLQVFLSYFRFVASKEIALVYNMSIEEAEREMKKYQLAQKVEKVPVKHGTFWRALD
ncbi:MULTISPECIES: ClpXP adapter SpxH family protein [Bacillaceae]|uniref:ClpXP adapter protein SpxH n=1 Tax=Metabacillus sediminis TaxID=3117746 RepID=A0ABZ2NKG9_9BACI|nr:ClpXP adapter SpxH family protein [Bacillus sp. SJS]KZZ83705.1 dithiol-disulfide isomerase [Bacillus sp. SJS]